MASNPYDKYSQEIIGLEAQRETARKLRESGNLPLKGEMVSGHYIAPHWSNAIANALKGFTGLTLEENADKGIQDVQNRRTAERDAWLGAMPTAKQETLPEGVEGPTQSIKPKTEDYLQWATKGMALDPASAQMGMTYANLNEGRDQRKSELAAKLQDSAASRAEKADAQRQLFQMQQEGRMDMARLAASLRPAPAAHQEKMISVIGPDGVTPTLIPQSQAAGMQPFVAGAATGKLTPQQAAQKDANDAIGILRQAVPIVGKATSSGIGAGMDWAAGLVGASPAGADAAAQMKVLGGALVSKMPKMSGPQSDKDVLLYKEMAGRIGDPTVPLSQKKQAMQTIYDLQVQYGGASGDPLFSDAAGSTKGKQGGSVFNVDQSAIDAELTRRRGGR